MKRILIIICFVLSVVAGKSQEIKFSASSSHSSIPAGERFRITFTVNANASGFKAPDLSAFDVYNGPNQSSSVQMINNSFTQSLSYYYTVSARKPGKYTIAPASIQVGNGRIESNTITIEVTEGGKSSPNSGTQAQQQTKNQGGVTSDKIFIRAIVSKSKVYLGEAVTVTYKIYSKYNQISFADLKFPSFNGFYTEEIPNGINDKLEVENYKGSNWYSAELKRTMLLPQKSGSLEIPSLEATCIVRERAQASNIYEQFFGGGFRDVQVKIKSDLFKLDVQAHPTTAKPADFEGAVGKYTITGNVDKQQAKSGDAITFTLKIEGSGNLKLLDPPKLEFPAEFEVYDPQVKDQIKIGEQGMQGSRTFEYLMIPRAGGNYQIGPFTYSYFSPGSAKYVSVTIPAFPINVEKSAGDPVLSGRTGTGAAPKQLASDIRFIHPDSSGLEPIAEESFFLSLPFFVLSSLGPLALLIIFILQRRNKHRESNSGVYRIKSAGGLAQRRLKKAGELLKAGSKEAFYEEIFRALYGYLGDKLQLPTAQLSKEVIADKLKLKEIDPTHIQELERILAECEFARYAPGAETGMSTIYNETQALIVSLEKHLRA